MRLCFVFCNYLPCTTDIIATFILTHNHTCTHHSHTLLYVSLSIHKYIYIYIYNCFAESKMVDFQSRYRLHALGYTAPIVKDPCCKRHHLHEVSRLIHRNHYDRPGELIYPSIHLSVCLYFLFHLSLHLFHFPIYLSSGLNILTTCWIKTFP